MLIEHTVKKEYSGKKLMEILRDDLGLSRMLIKKLRLYGSVSVNSLHHRMVDAVYEGDHIELKYDEPEVPEPLNIKSRGNIKVLYSDKHLLIISKPPGIVTHPASNHQSDTLLDRFGELKLHPVSRLDRETSGIIVMARDPHSHYRLSLQHQEKKIIKKYTSINHGVFPFTKGIINAPIKRKPDSIMLRNVQTDGDNAVTEFHVCRCFSRLNVSVNEFFLKTGRTHQIRVHSLFCSNPIIGDGLYGCMSKDNFQIRKSGFLEDYISRQALHATYICFFHPVTGDKIEISDPIPDDMLSLIKIIEEKECLIDSLV